MCLLEPIQSLLLYSRIQNYNIKHNDTKDNEIARLTGLLSERDNTLHELTNAVRALDV